MRVFYILSTFFPDTCYILAQAETPLVHLQGQNLTAYNNGRVEVETCAFYVYCSYLIQNNPPYRVSIGNIIHWYMENYVSYIAGGEKQYFPTSLCFDNEPTDFIARRVYLAICMDRDIKLIEGNIRLKLTEEEEKSMSEEDIFEWYRITAIEFVDYTSNKRLTMKYMSDFSGNYIIETVKI